MTKEWIVKCRLAAAFALAACGGTVAATDVADLNAAREEARTALAGGFSDLNEGLIRLVELADRTADMAFATNATPAMQRVLHEGAFNMYRTAGALERAAEKRVPFWINLGTDAEFEFAACPAGSFMMGCDGDPKSESFRHNVNISRPFWMARLQTTKRLYSTFRRVEELSDEERLYGGMDIPTGGLSRFEMDAFCEFLTNANKDRIPEGYVFRLPTDAEWEYALNAGCDDPSDPYVKFRNGDKTVADEISVTVDFVNRLREEHGLPALTVGQGAVFKAGTCRPNAWGIFDMLGNGGETVFDTICADIGCPYGEGVFDIDTPFDFEYKDVMTDPVHHSSATNRLGMMRGAVRWQRFGPRWYGRTVVDCGRHYGGHYTFRIVLAPQIPCGSAVEGGGE